MTATARRTKPVRDERGSISTWAVLASLCMMLVLGLGVDLAGHVAAEQRARQVAFEAARTGGQQVELDALATTGTLTPDPARVSAAADGYLTAAGYTGTTTVGATTVSVTATGDYECRFLTLLGIDWLPVTGTGQVEINRVLDGRPR
ncbi:hypothetical protein EDD41_0624 [Luteococcus japonicus]|uniref:Flp pilus-assembly TadE/G-like protein n=1 Tax=Luteococcus japonicus TaxID=33984 RepID=A0A3N1ZRF8_9ACTN|nr:pilus assembly protein [Luteococcus japonicus]ROR53471.1 hypothetical protein EDD41_0624 [Luteococcus japonicus]